MAVLRLSASGLPMPTVWAKSMTLATPVRCIACSVAMLRDCSSAPAALIRPMYAWSKSRTPPSRADSDAVSSSVVPGLRRPVANPSAYTYGLNDDPG
jgi:hypothetical protein